MPGDAWQEGLESALGRSTVCAVLIGPQGLGPWQNEELRSAIEERVSSRGYRVIPVFLPGTEPKPENLPRFLRRYTACTFETADDPEGMRRLLAGIRGEAPGRGAAATAEAPGHGMPVATEGPKIRPALGVETITWRRSRVVDEALDAYRAAPMPIVLHGLAGMGKTVAACHVVEELVAEDGREVVAVPAAPTSAADSTWALGFLAPGTDKGPLLDLLRDRIAEYASRDVVLVLDGLRLAPGDWAAAVLEQLAGGCRATVVITADRRPEPVLPLHAVAVPPLSEAESVAFIEHYARLFRLDLEPDRLAREIRPALLSYPISLRALLGLARTTPASLLAASLARAAPPDLAAGLVAGLDPDDLRMLALADVVAGAPVAGLLAAAVPLPATFGESLARLVDRCLVHLVADTVEVPALVADAIDRTHPDERAGAVAEVRAALAAAAADPGCSADVLAVVYAAVVARAAADEDWESVTGLCTEPLLERLNLHGRWKEYLLLLRLRVTAADRAGVTGDRIDYRLRLIRKLSQSRDFSGAWETLHEVAGVIDRSAPQRRAEYLSHRGFLNHLERDAEAAQADLTEALELHRANDNAYGLLIVFKLLGHLHLGRHDYALAAPPYREALAIAEEIGDTKQRLEIESSLAVCESHLDGAEVAERRLRRVIEELEAGDFRPELARTLLNLTVVLESQDRLAEARETALRGARIATPDTSITVILEAMADRISRRVPALGYRRTGGS